MEVVYVVVCGVCGEELTIKRGKKPRYHCSLHGHNVRPGYASAKGKTNYKVKEVRQ